MTDADRLPWLDSIAALIDRWSAEGVCGVYHVLRLEARLPRSYSRGKSDVEFIYLRGARELVSSRITQRMGHFMPPSLLDSQFATLEEPGEDEPAITVDIGGSPERDR